MHFELYVCGKKLMLFNLKLVLEVYQSPCVQLRFLGSISKHQTHGGLEFNGRAYKFVKQSNSQLVLCSLQVYLNLQYLFYKSNILSSCFEYSNRMEPVAYRTKYFWVIGTF